MEKSCSGWRRRAILRFCQSDNLNATFGGGEANVAVSLANYGIATEFVTRLPKNDIARACVMDLRKYGVGTNHIVYGGDRLGIYFLETGAVATRQQSRLRPRSLGYLRNPTGYGQLGKRYSKRLLGSIGQASRRLFLKVQPTLAWRLSRRPTAMGRACFLRPELSQEPLEIWQNCFRNHARTGGRLRHHFRQRGRRLRRYSASNRKALT